MNPWDLVHALQNTTKRNEKERLLKGIDQSSPFWEGAKMALDPMTTFGIKQLPAPEAHGAGVTFAQFKDLAGKLTSRALTGNAARDAVARFAEQATESQWRYWYSRVLAKNLDCGAAVNLISAHAPAAFKVTPFGCQLAIDMKNVRTEQLPRRAAAEAKYDGTRAVWFVKKPTESDGGLSVMDADVRCFSRNGKEFYNFGAIGAQLACLTRAPEFPDDGIVIDGEVIGADFSSLMAQARRKRDVDDSDLVLMAFDIMSVSDFLERRSTPPLSVRRKTLEGAMEYLRSSLGDAGVRPSVHLSAISEEIDLTTDAGRAAAMDFFTQQVEAGFEGAIVKNLEAPYTFERSDWYKIKPTDTWDLEVVSLEEGTGRLKGSLGALVCRGLSDDGKLIEVRVGSGLKDDERASMWASGEVGWTAEVLADSISHDQSGGYSLRFPRFLKRRFDK